MKTTLHYYLTAILILLFSILFILFHISQFGENVYWWTHDGAAYIEAARNYSATGNLAISTGIFNLNDTAYISAWPPGYPLLLSFLQDIIGIDSQWLSVYISILSWMIAPPIIFLFVRPLLGTTISAFLSILVLTSPAAIDWGWTDMTDMPFFLIVLLGLFLSCRVSSGWKPTFSVFVGGALLGVAFSIRHIGAAALMAVFASYIVMFYVRSDQWRDNFYKLIAWGAGATIIVGPLFIHNIMIFGSIQPYQRAPSTITLPVSIEEYTHATIHDLFGFREPIFVIIIGLMVIGLSLYFLYRNSDFLKKGAHSLLDEFGRSPSNAFALIAITMYFLLGMAIVIYARTKYSWGETIGLRHVMQYDWAALTTSFFFLPRLIDERRAKTIIYTFCTIMILGHIYYASTKYYIQEPKFGEKSMQKQKTYINEAIEKEVVGLSKQGIYIASNFHDTLRIKTALPIGRLYLRSNKQELILKLQEQLLRLQKRLHGTGDEGRVFVFSKMEKLDKVMEERLSGSGIVVKRRDESLIVFYMLPD